MPDRTPSSPPASPPAVLLPPRYGPPISLGAAKVVMEAAESEALRNRWPMVISIVDSTGHLVALHRLEQAQYGSVHVAQAKAETALTFAARPRRSKRRSRPAEWDSGCWECRMSHRSRAAFS